MIKPLGKGKFVVTNEAGAKKLSKPLSHGQAMKRLEQIDYFKNKGKK